MSLGNLGIIVTIYTSFSMLINFGFSRDSAEVGCFAYTVHCVSSGIASKLGSCIVFRRSAEPMPLAVHLVLNRAICSVSSENLSKMLLIYGSRLRKTASKSLKIKTILKLDEVKNLISESDVQDIEKMCEEMDAKRRSRSAAAEDEDEDDEQAEALRMILVSVISKGVDFSIVIISRFNSTNLLPQDNHKGDRAHGGGRSCFGGCKPASGFDSGRRGW